MENDPAVTRQSFQDALNQTTWSRPSSRRELGRGTSFIDRGEGAAFDYVATKVRGTPILDLGVGLGRTVPFLRPLTDEYRALDYLPPMVDAARRRHPDACIELGDARTLDGYPAGHFGLVAFSYNGVDALSSTDRRRVLQSVRRVLAPAGLFFFSTLNLDGPSYRERPWKPRVWRTRNPLRYAWRVAEQVAWTPLNTVNWFKVRRHGANGPGYAVAPLSAHHYGVLVHYTTLERELRELQEEGFAPNALVFGNNGAAPLTAGTDTTAIDWFHIVAARA